MRCEQEMHGRGGRHPSFSHQTQCSRESTGTWSYTWRMSGRTDSMHMCQQHGTQMERQGWRRTS